MCCWDIWDGGMPCLILSRVSIQYEIFSHAARSMTWASGWSGPPRLIKNDAVSFWRSDLRVTIVCPKHCAPRRAGERRLIMNRTFPNHGLTIGITYHRKIQYLSSACLNWFFHLNCCADIPRWFASSLHQKSSWNEYEKWGSYMLPVHHVFVQIPNSLQFPCLKRSKGLTLEFILPFLIWRTRLLSIRE